MKSILRSIKKRKVPNKIREDDRNNDWSSSYSPSFSLSSMVSPGRKKNVSVHHNSEYRHAKRFDAPVVLNEDYGQDSPTALRLGGGTVQINKENNSTRSNDVAHQSWPLNKPVNNTLSSMMSNANVNATATQIEAGGFKAHTPKKSYESKETFSAYADVKNLTLSPLSTFDANSPRSSRQSLSSNFSNDKPHPRSAPSKRRTSRFSTLQKSCSIMKSKGEDIFVFHAQDTAQNTFAKKLCFDNFLDDAEDNDILPSSADDSFQKSASDILRSKRKSRETGLSMLSSPFRKSIKTILGRKRGRIDSEDNRGSAAISTTYSTPSTKESHHSMIISPKSDDCEMDGYAIAEQNRSKKKRQVIDRDGNISQRNIVNRDEKTISNLFNFQQSASELAHIKPYTVRLMLVEARNLSNSETGFKCSSDPYVRIHLHGEQAQSSNVVKSCRNPTWNQNFIFTLMIDDRKHHQQTSQYLTVSVYDYDAILDHTCIGQAQIKLDDLLVQCRTNWNGSSNIVDQWLTLDLPRNSAQLTSSNQKSVGEVHVTYQITEGMNFVFSK